MIDYVYEYVCLCSPTAQLMFHAKPPIWKCRVWRDGWTDDCHKTQWYTYFLYPFPCVRVYICSYIFYIYNILLCSGYFHSFTHLRSILHLLTFFNVKMWLLSIRASVFLLHGSGSNFQRRFSWKYYINEQRQRTIPKTNLWFSLFTSI